MTKWEYCEILQEGISDSFQAAPAKYKKIYGQGPTSMTKIKGNPRNIIGELGLEGWELVSYSYAGYNPLEYARELWILKREIQSLE